MAGSVLTFGRPEREFAMIRNDFIRNPEIKPSPFRVALYVFSTSETFRLTQVSIARALNMNESTVRTAFQELERLNLLIRVPQRDERGHRAPDDLYLNQVPFTDAERQQLLAEAQPGKIQGGESPGGKTPAPKKITSDQKTTDQEDQKDSCPAGAGREPAKAESKTVNAIIDAEFADWWAAYPRKVAKGQAERAYRTARKNGASQADLLEGIRAHAAAWARRKTETQYKPYPATWLNGKRWLDDPEAIAVGGSSARGSQPGPGVVHTAEDRAQQEASWAAMPKATPISQQELEELFRD